MGMQDGFGKSEILSMFDNQSEEDSIIVDMWRCLEIKRDCYHKVVEIMRDQQENPG